MSENFIKKYKKGNETLYKYIQTVYYNPDPENSKNVPDNQKYKKITGSGYRTKTEAKRHHETARIEAIKEIEERFNNPENNKHNLNSNHLTLINAHKATIGFGLKEGSIKKYDSIFNNYIKPYFDVNEDVENVLNATSISKWKESLENIFKEEKYIFKTQYTILTRVKKIFNYAIIQKNLDKRLLDVIQIKKGKTSNNTINYKDIWTKEEFHLFINGIDEEDFVYKVFFSIMERALRFSETRGLKVNDVYVNELDGKKQYRLRIRRTMIGGSSSQFTDPKSISSKRTIEISEELYSMIQKMVKENDLKKEDFLFKTKGSTGVMNDKKFRQKFHYYKNKFVPHKKKMRPHHFRHRLATEALKQNKSITAIAKHLGDTYEQVFKAYVLNLDEEESLLDI